MLLGSLNHLSPTRLNSAIFFRVCEGHKTRWEKFTAKKQSNDRPASCPSGQGRQLACRFPSAAEAQAWPSSTCRLPKPARCPGPETPSSSGRAGCRPSLPGLSPAWPCRWLEHFTEAQRIDATAKGRLKRHVLRHFTEAQRRDTTAKGRLKQHVLLHFTEAQRIDTTAKGRLKQHVLLHFTEAQRIDTTAKGRLKPHVLRHFTESQRRHATAKGRLKRHVLQHFTEAQRRHTTAKGHVEQHFLWHFTQAQCRDTAAKERQNGEQGASTSQQRDIQNNTSCSTLQRHSAETPQQRDIQNNTSCSTFKRHGIFDPVGT